MIIKALYTLQFNRGFDEPALSATAGHASSAVGLILDLEEACSKHFGSALNS